MKKLIVCECADPLCPTGHTGENGCERIPNLHERTMLYRVDMDDRTGTRFCSDCYEDAIESGLFSISKR